MAFEWGQGWYWDGDWGCTSTAVGMRLGVSWGQDGDQNQSRMH